MLKNYLGILNNYSKHKNESLRNWSRIFSVFKCSNNNGSIYLLEHKVRNQKVINYKLEKSFFSIYSFLRYLKMDLKMFVVLNNCLDCRKWRKWRRRRRSWLNLSLHFQNFTKQLQTNRGTWIKVLSAEKLIRNTESLKIYRNIIFIIISSITLKKYEVVLLNFFLLSEKSYC